MTEKLPALAPHSCHQLFPGQLIRKISAGNSAGSTHNRNGAVGMCNNVLTHRTQQHPGKAISATRPNDNQVGTLGPVDQHLGGVSLFDRRLDFNRWCFGLEVSNQLLKHGKRVGCWLGVIALRRYRSVWRLLRQHGSAPWAKPRVMVDEDVTV
jgi:hypothetical protein